MSPGFLLATLLAIAFALVRAHTQRRRIVLLAQQLRPFRIEPLMEQVVDGTLRWVGERDAERRAPVRAVLDEAERTLAGQVERFAAGFARVPDADARTGRLPLWLPAAITQALGQQFDARQLFALHARAIGAAVQNADGLGPEARAFRLVAELMLFQHSCHWYCRSRGLASARLVARHKTPWRQVMQAIAPDTLRSYRSMTGA